MKPALVFSAIGLLLLSVWFTAGAVEAGLHDVLGIPPLVSMFVALAIALLLLTLLPWRVSRWARPAWRRRTLVASALVWWIGLGVASGWLLYDVGALPRTVRLPLRMFQPERQACLNAASVYLDAVRDVEHLELDDLSDTSWAASREEATALALAAYVREGMSTGTKKERETFPRAMGVFDAYEVSTKGLHISLRDISTRAGHVRDGQAFLHDVIEALLEDRDARNKAAGHKTVRVTSTKKKSDRARWTVLERVFGRAAQEDVESYQQDGVTYVVVRKQPATCTWEDGAYRITMARGKKQEGYRKARAEVDDDFALTNACHDLSKNGFHVLAELQSAQNGHYVRHGGYAATLDELGQRLDGTPWRGAHGSCELHLTRESRKRFVASVACSEGGQRYSATIHPLGSVFDIETSCSDDHLYRPTKGSEGDPAAIYDDVDCFRAVHQIQNVFKEVVERQITALERSGRYRSLQERERSHITKHAADCALEVTTREGGQQWSATMRCPIPEMGAVEASIDQNTHAAPSWSLGRCEGKVSAIKPAKPQGCSPETRAPVVAFLRDIHRLQVEHHQRTGRYAAKLEEIGLTRRSRDCFVGLTPLTDDYVAEVSCRNDDESLTAKMRKDLVIEESGWGGKCTKPR